MQATLPLALGLAALAAACGKVGDTSMTADTSPATAPSSSESVPEVTPAVRRPTRRYFMERLGGRCEVYFTDPDLVSARLEAPCPEQIASGERIRLAGKVCLREGAADPARDVPVLCPDHLLRLEHDERARGR